MKLQVGLFYRDGRSATVETLTTILGEHVSSQFETSGELIDGPLAIAYRGDRIACEEDNEVQPLCIGPYVLTFDGRLDNRDDIAAQAGLLAKRSTSDPYIILTAYMKRGDVILKELVGEFALVLWQRDTRSLVFARSIDAARPLYYIVDNERITWASSFTHLVSVNNVDRTINDEYMSEYLVSDSSPTSTPFARVSVVAPGTLVRLNDRNSCYVTKLWEYRDVPIVTQTSDHELESRLLDLLTEAVQVRMRTKGPVFSELSGGLDSSSIVLLGDQVLRRSGQSPDLLKSISCVYNESESCDETYFIRVIEAKRGVDSFYVHEKDQQFGLGLESESFIGLPNLFGISPGRFPSILGHMSSVGARVLLTGLGGDHLFLNTPNGTAYVADHLYNAHLVQAHHQCRAWSRFTGIPYGRLLGQALLFVMAPALPERWQYDPFDIAPWLRDKRAAGLSTQMTGSVRNAGVPSKRYRALYVEALFRTIATGQWNAWDEKLYVSHPFTHRPLVEFCLGLPMGQMARDCQLRSLMRRSLNGILPDKTMARKGKGSLFEALVRMVGREWAKLERFETWNVCERGYINAEMLRQSFRKLRLGLGDKGNSAAWRALALEGWFRSLKHLEYKLHNASTSAQLKLSRRDQIYVSESAPR